MITEGKKSLAKKLLCEKQQELGRTPKKEDFDEVTRSRIKAFLGPWPRALEAAGLKEPSEKKKRKKGKRSINQKKKTEKSETLCPPKKETE